ncbi:hypothetical protein BJY04DRAFT_218619 [Aspergillus karnatakaensis]|uniref:uncharacterized protein n=1 Tax=Aspergillus karnatakaensis TaxID=1810916 RepID=UPI003CCE23FD
MAIETPRLSLSLTGWRQLSARVANWPTNAITFTIRREEGGSGKPCIFRWNPNPSSLILRRQNSKGEMEEAPVTSLPHNLIPIRIPRTIQTTSLSSHREHKSRFRAHCQRNTDQYCCMASAAASSQNLTPARINIILVAGPSFFFQALTPHWPGPPPFNPKRPRPRVLEANARVAGAPVLTATLEVENKSITAYKWAIAFKIKPKITYHGVLSVDNENKIVPASPILLYVGGIVNYASTLLLERHRSNENHNRWEPCPASFACGLGNYLETDSLPAGFKQGLCEDFICLQPGESWTDEVDAEESELWDFPPDVADGDVFRVQHRGGVVGWWDWGRSEYLKRVLGSFESGGESGVLYPVDLGGRARLVVPGSEMVEVVFVRRGR